MVRKLSSSELFDMIQAKNDEESQVNKGDMMLMGKDPKTRGSAQLDPSNQASF